MNAPKEGIEGPAGELRTLQGELLLLMSDQVSRAWIQLVAVTGLMALLLSFYVLPLYPWLWFLAVNIGGYAHMKLLVRLREDDTRSDDSKLRLVAHSFTFQGLLRASLPLLFQLLPITICAIISIYNLGICAAVLYATSGARRVYWPYCAVTIAPMALAWLTAANLPASLGERLIFVALLLTFGATMLGHAKGAYGHFESSYRMRRERLQLNQQLREALHKAESASHAKTRFLASASHDLRQPIHALSLFSGSLSLRPLDARTAAIAEQIDKAITVLGSQLDALLDISRLDAGVVEKNLSVIDLKAMLLQLAQEFQPQADKRGLRLDIQCPENTLVRSDAGLLLRVLSNLVSNAIKYTRAGGVTLAVEPLHGNCRLMVSDSGPGIPAEEQQKVFEEFYQLENPERDRSKGLGLGLAIVQRLVALLDIDLQLHSSLGVGTQFELLLPCAVRPEQAEEIPMLDSPWPSTTLRVLVIDDEDAIRLGMKTVLEEMGFQVALASSTPSAAALAEPFRPSIVLADLRLHGDDSGLRAIETLRQRSPQLPALLISGDTAPDRLQLAHVAGIAVLHKPVSATQLRAAILKAVRT